MRTKNRNTIEVHPKVSRRPDAGISCYRCDQCHAIFTVAGHSGTEYYPVCHSNWADKIPKGLYNLIKAWRRIWQRDDIKAL